MENPFAQSLRALRQNKGLTQSELVRRSGIARRTLAYWEAGASLPRIPEL
ncbi:MAG: helix-turn-helix domain-containing protein [Armatimonadota bacterium]|nr:helix-turn-helix domain-containing protein [Armatimonadota bacterium]